VPISDRRSSNNWRFADAGSRFDANNRGISRDRAPIATTFTRKIIRCSRCGSRVVSNARRCPYCSKSLIPFYRSFVFWLTVVLMLATTSVYLIFFYDPVVLPPNTALRDPVPIGVTGQESAIDMPIGTTVDCNDLFITVISAEQKYMSSDGVPVYEIVIEIYNKTNSMQRLLSTQWVMQVAGGGHEECFIGKTDSGNSLSSGVEGRQLSPYEKLTTRIYFAAEIPLAVIYLINPLESDINTAQKVSWLVHSATPVDSPQGVLPAHTLMRRRHRA